PMIVETLHSMETTHAWCVFCFRRTKSFHDDGGGRAVATLVLPLKVDAGLGSAQLPRRLRCSGLAALRAAIDLPPDLVVVLWSRAEEASQGDCGTAGSR